MLSSPVADLPSLPPRRPMRRGGPHLFRTIWPEVRASLAESAGLALDEAPSEPVAGAEPHGPPWFRAA